MRQNSVYLPLLIIIIHNAPGRSNESANICLITNYTHTLLNNNLKILTC